MTYIEIYKTLEYLNENEQEQLSNRLYFNYNLAVNIVNFMSASMAGKPIPKFEQLYPDLIEANNQSESVELQVEKIHAQLYEFTNSFNKRHMEINNE